MIVVQSTGCAPVVKAWDEGKPGAEFWPQARTLAAGLRVPKAYGDYLILEILRNSKGTAIAVSDQDIMDALRQWARVEGIFAAPEGAASLAAYRQLLRTGFLKKDDTVVLFNTGSGLKYLDVVADNLGMKTGSERNSAAQAPAPRQIGGIIGPY